MQYLKTLSRAAMFVTLPVSLLAIASGFISDRISEIHRTQASRSRVQAQIHETLHSQHAGSILETRLLNRCGIVAYMVTMRDTAGSEYNLYYDIDNGAPVRRDLLNGCTGRVTDSPQRGETGALRM